MPPPILTGSHLDTVKTGGAYDGAYGVVGAMCALELLDARNITTEHPIEATAWVGEEGSRFPLGCLGSAVFAGLTSAEHALALTDEIGTTLGDALAHEDGGLLRDVPQRANNDVAGYVELHVEQGPILERAGARLGIVTAIASQRRFRVTLEGESGHAGTVPMAIRSDSLGGAAEIILAIESTARALGEAVVTVGRLTVEPGSTNVIPARVSFSVDMRSPYDAHVDAIEQTLRDAMSRAESTRRRADLDRSTRRTQSNAHDAAHARSSSARRERNRRAQHGRSQRRRSRYDVHRSNRPGGDDLRSEHRRRQSRRRRENLGRGPRARGRNAGRRTRRGRPRPKGVIPTADDLLHLRFGASRPA